jgi:hypothetical protein
MMSQHSLRQLDAWLAGEMRNRDVREMVRARMVSHINKNFGQLIGCRKWAWIAREAGCFEFIEQDRMNRAIFDDVARMHEMGQSPDVT